MQSFLPLSGSHLWAMHDCYIILLKLKIMKLEVDWACKSRNHCGVISWLLVCMRAIRTKLGNEAHWGSGVSLLLSNQDHLGSRIGISLPCDYSVLHTHHVDDSLNMLQDEGDGWDKEGAANSFLSLPIPHWKWMRVKRRGERAREREQRGGWRGRWGESFHCYSRGFGWGALWFRQAPWHGSPACPQSKPTAAINGKN